MRARICILLLSWGCARESKIDSNTLVIGIESDITNLDLRYSADANMAQVARLMSQGLVKTNRELMADTDLASHFESKDDITYRFELPSDARFHDGSALSSADVLYSFKQAAAPGSRVRSSFSDVESFSAPDPQTFIIKLKAPRASFLLGDAAAIKILPARLAESTGYAQRPIGSGPYKFIEQRDRDLLFERFPQYKAFTNGKLQQLPTFERVIVRAISDPTTRFLSLVGGDIDILFNALSPRRVQEAATLPRLRVYSSPGTSYNYIGFNLKVAKLQDLRVRRALALAIDRDSLIRHKLRGFAKAATSILSPQNFFFNSSIPQTPFDPVTARKLLAEAGAKNLTITLKTSTDRDSVSMLQAIVKQWEDVGVNARLDSREFATFFADVQKGNFEAFSLRWTAVTEPDIMMKIFHSSETPPGRNRISYANPRVDRLLEQARHEPKAAKRRELYLSAQELIQQDVPYVSLWYPDNIAVATSQLKGFYPDPTGSWMPALEATKEASK